MKKKISWRFKMVLLMLVAVVGAIAVTWVLNRTFLEDYYLYNKMNMLDKVFQSVHEVIVQAENNLQTEAESMEDASEGIILDEFGNSKSEKKRAGNAAAFRYAETGTGCTSDAERCIYSGGTKYESNFLFHEQQSG